MSTFELQAALDGLLTAQQTAALFGVTPMTVHLWRQNRNLPAVVLPGQVRPAVRFHRGDVMRWAADQGVRLRVRAAA